MLMLLDSAGLYFRAFHGVPESITAPDGTPVNAVRGFLDMCTTLVTTRQPSGVVACWDDDWRPQWRVDLVPEYKAHRVAPGGGEVEPPSLSDQVVIISEVLAALGVPRVGAAGHEADDVLATLARRHGRRGEPVEVVTGDRDLIQLVDDSLGITVLYTGRGVRRLQVLDEAAVRAGYGVAPAQYADLALLRGDASDGLPGVPGVGPRTAADLLVRFGDLAAILAHAATAPRDVRPGVVRALLDAQDYLRRAAPVVRVVDDLPIPDLPGTLPPAAADAGALDELGLRWGVTAPLARLRQALWPA